MVGLKCFSGNTGTAGERDCSLINNEFFKSECHWLSNNERRELGVDRGISTSQRQPPFCPGGICSTVCSLDSPALFFCRMAKNRGGRALIELFVDTCVALDGHFMRPFVMSGGVRTTVMNGVPSPYPKIYGRLASD